MAASLHPENPILVVEDHDDLRETLAMALEAEGYAVATARHGAEALQYLRRCPPPCLILLDLSMPVMSGWEFREKQRGDPALAAIPVIVLSAVADVNPKEPPLEALDFLSKPVSFELLLEKVGRYCAPSTPDH